MTSLTLFIKSNDIKRCNRTLRNGQCLMQALFVLNKDLYNEVTGTDNDPFYVDDNIPKLLEFLETHFN
jgi:hypothetical protein